jgi:hypothetical protein
LKHKPKGKTSTLLTAASGSSSRSPTLATSKPLTPIPTPPTGQASSVQSSGSRPSRSNEIVDLTNDVAGVEDNLDAATGTSSSASSPTGTSSAIFDDYDARYITFTRQVETRKGGAPPNPIYRKLLILCHPVGVAADARTFDNAILRCPASAWCDKVFHQNKRSKTLISHAAHCSNLPRALRQLAEDEGASNSLGAAIAGTKRARETIPGAKDLTTSTSTPLAPSTAFPVADWAQLGKEEQQANADLALLIWAVDAGVSFRSLDHPMFRRYNAIISRAKYASKSSTTIVDSQLRSEAALVRKNIVTYLREQRNLTLTFDGQTIRSQEPIYTVHVTTSDRRIFLIKGDISFQSHTAEYIRDVLSEVVEKIGPWCFLGVCSDNTGNTRKGRRLLCDRYPHIVNMADPCHKLNLLIQDIANLKEFETVSEYCLIGCTNLT